MGQRSEIFAAAVKSGSEVETIMVAGSVAFVAESMLEVPLNGCTSAMRIARTCCKLLVSRF